ncbi:hypothetical protein BCR42DRAFT_52376 [Absidia repens]|uniref:Uncharacterized protein n=1 Tax=Absidia repens TaxID=90262 RepID=A0A1X2IF69_9FUNG|nr:hypothetical protein BCR42DRAFT_52376 [Absidia repens]
MEASESRTHQHITALSEQYEQLRKDYDVLSRTYREMENQRNQLQQKVTDLATTMTQSTNDSQSSHGSNDSKLHKTDQHNQVGLQQTSISVDQQQQNYDIQHKNELELLYNQYQQLIDVKDQELEDYGSRVQTLTSEQKKALESCRMELGDRISLLEAQVNDYEATIHSQNEILTTLQTQIGDMEQQKQKDQQIIHALIEEKTVLEDQLNRWMRYAI